MVEVFLLLKKVPGFRNQQDTRGRERATGFGLEGEFK